MILTRLFRFWTLFLLTWAFVEIGANRDLVLFGSLSFLVSILFKNHQIALTDWFLQITIGILGTWWPIYNSLKSMGHGAAIIICFWIGFIFWHILSKTKNYFPDACAFFALSLCSTPEHVFSIGQGMSFGIQTGILSILLSERIFSRISEGYSYRSQKLLVVLVVFLHLFLIQSLKIEGTYEWIHWRFFATAALIICFLWTTPFLTENLDSGLAWLACPTLPVILAAFLVQLKSGETIFQIRQNFCQIHPNLLAASYLFSGIILDSFFVRHYNSWWLRSFLLLIIATGIYATQSRLCLALFIFNFFYRHFTEGFKKTKEGILIFIIIMLIYLGGISIEIIPKRFDVRYIPLERLYIYKAAIERIVEKPFGEGFLQYGFKQQKISSENHYKIYDWYYPHTHQIFLEALLSFGIPLAVVLFCYLLFILKSKQGSPIAHKLLIFHLLMGIFDFNLYSPFMISTLVLGIIGLAKNRVKITPAPIYCLAVSFLMLFFSCISFWCADVAAIHFRYAWQNLYEGNLYKTIEVLNYCMHLDKNRIEYPLYSAMLHWQKGATGFSESKKLISTAKSLASNWEVPLCAEEIQSWLENNGLAIKYPDSVFANKFSPDVSGWRNGFLVLQSQGSLNFYAQLGLAIAKNGEIGELIIGSPPPFGQEFVKKALQHFFEKLPEIWPIPGILWFCVNSCPNLIEEIPWPNTQLKQIEPLSETIRTISALHFLNKKNIDLASKISEKIPSNTDFGRFLYAKLAFEKGEYQNSLAWITAFHKNFDCGNEGNPHLLGKLLEAQTLYSLKRKTEAIYILRRIFEWAPTWMSPRIFAAEIASGTDLYEGRSEFAKEGLRIIQTLLKRPTSLSHYEYENRPVGDNWVVLFIKQAVQQFIEKQPHNFIPFQEQKLKYWKFWESRTK